MGSGIESDLLDLEGLRALLPGRNRISAGTLARGGRGIGPRRVQLRILRAGRTPMVRRVDFLAFLDECQRQYEVQPEPAPAATRRRGRGHGPSIEEREKAALAKLRGDAR